MCNPFFETDVNNLLETFQRKDSNSKNSTAIYQLYSFHRKVCFFSKVFNFFDGVGTLSCQINEWARLTVAISLILILDNNNMY